MRLFCCALTLADGCSKPAHALPQLQVSFSSVCITCSDARWRGARKKSKLPDKHSARPATVSFAVSLAVSCLIASAVGMRTGILGDKDFWMRECNASSRSTFELLQSNNISGWVAVSRLFVSSLSPLLRHAVCLFLLSDHAVCICCCDERDMLRAAAQAAAVAATRLGGGGRPHMGAPRHVQRLDVRWLRCGHRHVRCISSSRL